MKTIRFASTLMAIFTASAIAADLPNAEQVKSVTIKFNHPELSDVRFGATAKDWETIRAALTPAEQDPMPANWEWLGTVNIVKKDGEPLHVELYSTSSEPGAFAAGETFDKRKYFRGGKTSDLRKALMKAFENSKAAVGKGKVRQ